MQISNVLEKKMIRAGVPLNAEDEIIKDKGLVLILRELHDKIDALAAEAYGWPNGLSDDEILLRLAALNAERAAEEKRGITAGCAQIISTRGGRCGAARAGPTGKQLKAALVIEAGKGQKPSFPASDSERMAAVYAVLSAARTPLDACAIASAFRQGAKVEPAISRILAAWERVGQFPTSGGKSYALRRSA